MNRMYLWVFLASGLLFSGCVSHYKVRVDFSSELQTYFNEVPSIEVDIAAVTDKEADEVKQMGVEKYFAPDNGIRERLQSQICYFERENNYSFELPSGAPVWKTWMLKSPKSILVIASLPHGPSMTPQSDPRYFLVTMKKRFLIARRLYVLVEPQKIIPLTKPPKKPKDGKIEDPDAYQQWIRPVK